MSTHPTTRATEGWMSVSSGALQIEQVTFTLRTLLYASDGSAICISATIKSISASVFVRWRRISKRRSVISLVATKSLCEIFVIASSISFITEVSDDVIVPISIPCLVPRLVKTFPTNTVVAFVSVCQRWVIPCAVGGICTAKVAVVFTHAVPKWNNSDDFVFHLVPFF